MFGKWLNFSNEVEVTHHALRLPRLSAAFAGYRIVQISDLHVGEWDNERRLPAVLELANRQKPDLIVITGDLVSIDPPAYIEPLTRLLRLLSAPDGVFAVLGNHDHHHEAGIVRQVLASCGISELNNRTETIYRNGSRLHLAGIDSHLRGESCLPEVLAQLPEDGAAILLAHEPGFATISAAAGRFDLQLSGHSHGGQVRLPWIGSIFYPEHVRPYPSGLYHVNGMVQYTNRGVGLAHLPIRLNCPPEISVFDLYPPESQR